MPPPTKKPSAAAAAHGSDRGAAPGTVPPATTPPAAATAAAAHGKDPGAAPKHHRGDAPGTVPPTKTPPAAATAAAHGNHPGAASKLHRGDAPGRAVHPTFKEQADSVPPLQQQQPTTPPYYYDAALPTFKDQVRPLHREVNDEEIGDTARKPPAVDTAVPPETQQQQQLQTNASFVPPMAEGIPVSLEPYTATVAPLPPPAPQPERSLVLKKHIVWGIVVLGAVIVITVGAIIGSLLISNSNNGSGSTTTTQSSKDTNQPSTTAMGRPAATTPPSVTVPPITLEPTVDNNINPYIPIDEVAKLTASDGASDDNFGWSVAMDGDTLGIGSALDDTENGNNTGSAHVYTRLGAVWTEQAMLIASDGAENDWFGRSVAITGDTIVVGAWMDDTENGNGSGSGSAYVYTRSGTVWTDQAKLTASDGAADDFFGQIVAINGDTIVVGAWMDDTENGNGSGSAYVYTHSGTVWTEQAKLTASDGAAYDYFGNSVAINGDTIVIGARNSDTENGSGSGSAYVYTRTGTVWTKQAKLIASDGASSDWFGTSVAMDGDTIVIGAFGVTENDNNSGSAYVYTLSGTVWMEQAKLTASDGAADNNFGSSVAINGDTIVIGAYRDDTKSGSGSGSAYMYTRSGTVWTQQAKLTASDGAEDDWFGYSVAMDGGTLVIGSHQDDTENGSKSGSAYIFA